MNATQATGKKPQRIGWAGLLIFVLLLGIVVGKVPNPLERFFEMDAGTYHSVDVVLTVSKSPRLAAVLKGVLDLDGKLTQANMEHVWPVYEEAMPNGFMLPAHGDADRDTERARLIAHVGAHPQRSVPTFND